MSVTARSKAVPQTADRKTGRRRRDAPRSPQLPKTTPPKAATGNVAIRTTDVMVRAVALRRSGLTLAEAGARLGVHKTTVLRAVRRYLALVVAAGTAELQQLRQEQLAEVQVAKAKTLEELSRVRGADGTAKLVLALVRLEEREARLMGLDKQPAAWTPPPPPARLPGEAGEIPAGDGLHVTQNILIIDVGPELGHGP